METLEIVLDVITGLCLLVGSLSCILGSLGVIRFPDIYARTHATGLTDTMGAGLILFGLMLQSHTIGVGFKLLFTAIFIWVTGPTATHALAQSAHAHGIEPTLSDVENPLLHQPGDHPEQTHDS